MRPLSILTAIIVMAALYFLVLQREALFQFAGTGGSETISGDLDYASDTGVAGDEGVRTVPVVALRSSAGRVDGAVVLRGRTEAARQVEVRAETTGQVISDPARKGAFVDSGGLLYELDRGTQRIPLDEAEVRQPW